MACNVLAGNFLVGGSNQYPVNKNTHLSPCLYIHIHTRYIEGASFYVYTYTRRGYMYIQYTYYEIGKSSQVNFNNYSLQFTSNKHSKTTRRQLSQLIGYFFILFPTFFHPPMCPPKKQRRSDQRRELFRLVAGELRDQL